MSDKIIDKIELIKELGNIKKLISNKKTKGEKLSPKEYFDFCELVKSHRYGQPLLYLNLETAYELSQILPDLDEILSSVDKNERYDKAELFYEMISKSSNCFARYENKDQAKLHSFIKDRIKEDNEKGLKFYTFFTHFKFERIKYTDLMDIVNLGKKNNFADYLFYQYNGPGGSLLNKGMIDKVFKNCDGILKQDSFANFIFYCEDRAISKEVLNKLFGVSFDFDIPVRQLNNKFSFYLFCRKCEKGAIDKQTLEKIFSKLKIEQYFLTESDIEDMLPAFDTEAQEYLKNEFKKMGLPFNFQVKKQKTFDDFSKLAGELKEKITFENWQDCLELMDCAPDFDTSKCVYSDGRTFLFNDNIVDKDFCAGIREIRNFAEKVIDKKTSEGKKFELNELKAMVLSDSWPACESYFNGLKTKEEFDKKNKALMACVPEKIDFVYLYWICQFYDTKYEWCDKLCVMDEDTITFYVDRLDESSPTNQYMLFSFLNAIKPGVINLDQAKKLLKNVIKLKDDAYPKINDEDAKKFLSKFDNQAQEFVKNWLETFEKMEPQEWTYDASKYNGEDKENKDEKNDLTRKKLEKQKTFDDFHKYIVGLLDEKKFPDNLKDLLKLMSLAPDYYNGEACGNSLFNDVIVEENFCDYHDPIRAGKSIDIKNIAKKILSDALNTGKKLELNELKAMVIPGGGGQACETYFDVFGTKEEFDKKNKDLMALVPDKIDFVYLYWICQFYETVNDEDSLICVMDKNTATFYIDRLDKNSPTNQYMLCSFLAAVRPGVLSLEQAKKLFKNFVKAKGGAYTEINDEDAKKLLSKFDNEAQEFVKQQLEIIKKMEPQEWTYDASKHNGEDKENKDENNNESEEHEEIINTDTEEHHTENPNGKKAIDDKVLYGVINRIRKGEKLDDQMFIFELSFVNEFISDLAEFGMDNDHDYMKFVADVKKLLNDTFSKLEAENQNSDINKIALQVNCIIRICPCLDQKTKDDYLNELKKAQNDPVSLKEIIMNIIVGLLNFITFRFEKGIKLMSSPKASEKEKRQKGIISKIKDKISRGQPDQNQKESKKGLGFRT